MEGRKANLCQFRYFTGCCHHLANLHTYFENLIWIVKRYFKIVNSIFFSYRPLVYVLKWFQYERCKYYSNFKKLPKTSCVMIAMYTCTLEGWWFVCPSVWVRIIFFNWLSLFTFQRIIILLTAPHTVQRTQSFINSKAHHLFMTILIFRAVAEPWISSKSAKSHEIHKNTRNPTKFARNLTKYMSAQHIWKLSWLLGLLTCWKLANLPWNFVTAARI